MKNLNCLKNACVQQQLSEPMDVADHQNKIWHSSPHSPLLPQQLYIGVTVPLGLLPPLLSARLWYLCHQTQWAWGFSSQAVRPLSGVYSFYTQDQNFRMIQLTVLLSRFLCFHCPIALPCLRFWIFLSSATTFRTEGYHVFQSYQCPNQFLFIPFFRGLASSLCFLYVISGLGLNSWFRSLSLSISVRPNISCPIGVVCCSLQRLC